jgi:hypothetical protein
MANADMRYIDAQEATADTGAINGTSGWWKDNALGGVMVC